MDANTTRRTYECKLPFAGFYESQWDSALDSEIESAAEWLANESEEMEGFSEEDIQNAIFHCGTFRASYAYIAEEYARMFAQELDALAGESLRLTYREMVSPREYNFSTDRIFCRLPRATVRKMRREVSPDFLANIAAERHTSRSGFISFYSPDVSTWGKVDTWDHNQLTTLLLAWIEWRAAESNETESGPFVNTLEDRIYERASSDGVFGDALWQAFNVAELREHLTEKGE